MVLSRASITLLFLLGSVALPLPGADAPPLETWMPDDVVGYARLSGLGARLEDLLKSDLRRRLESLEAVKHLLAQEPWRRFEHGLEELRNATGKDPLELFKTILGREVLVGARFGFMGPEVIVLTRAAGEKQLEETLRSIRSAVEQRGVFLDSTKTEREGRTIETFAGKVSLLTIGEVLAVSSSASALERVVDLAAGKASGSVKSSALFQKAGDPGGALASIAVRPQFIPNFHVPDKAENGPASLLLGGWLGALGGSELLTASLAVQEGDLVLELA
ncbi:MAG: hypothetical protein HY721_19130, partial [Planctomycetes bacterium]|nr:hypothetical protein [Planctomycetota bacterium]